MLGVVACGVPLSPPPPSKPLPPVLCAPCVCVCAGERVSVSGLPSPARGLCASSLCSRTLGLSPSASLLRSSCVPSPLPSPGVTLWFSFVCRPA